MMLMIGLRSQYVGSSDASFYYGNWEYMATVPLRSLVTTIKNTDLEIGYQFCVWLLSRPFHSGQWLFVLSGMFYAVTIGVFVYRNCRNAVLALVVFNCLGAFNFMVQGTRQAIAMCICLYAWELCKKRKFWKFMLMILLACSFHASAAVALIIYFLPLFKLNIKTAVAFTAVASIGIISLPVWVNLLNLLLNDNYEMIRTETTGGVVAILIYIVIIVCGVIYQDKDDKYYAMFVYISVIGALLMILRKFTIPIAERINYYFIFGQMVVLSNSIVATKNSTTRIVLNSVAALLCLGVAVYKTSYSVLIPYLFFWQ